MLEREGGLKRGGVKVREAQRTPSLTHSCFKSCAHSLLFLVGVARSTSWIINIAEVCAPVGLLC